MPNQSKSKVSNQGSGEDNQVDKDNKVKHSEDLDDEAPILLLLTIEFAQIFSPPLHILIGIVDVTLDTVDHQLLHSHHVHRLTVHLRNFIN